MNHDFASGECNMFDASRYTGFSRAGFCYRRTYYSRIEVHALTIGLVEV